MQEAIGDCGNYFGFYFCEPYRSLVVAVTVSFFVGVGAGLVVLYRKRMIRQALGLSAIASFVFAFPFIYGSIESVYNYVETGRQFENAVANCEMDPSCNEGDVISSNYFQNTINGYLSRLANFAIGAAILVAVGAVLLVIRFNGHYAKARSVST